MREWVKLQQETKGSEEMDEKDKEAMAMKDFMQIISYVKNN